MDLSKHDQVLAGLVLSLQAATMQHLGKITSVATGKMERDLDQARSTIDILEMLKEKCREGTPEEILTLLDKTVMELQLNYLDEMKKNQAGSGDSPDEEAADSDPGEDQGEDQETNQDEVKES